MKPRKEHGRGAVVARRCRASGRERVVYRPGVRPEAGDRKLWVTVCEHGHTVSSTTRNTAVREIADYRWCEDCAALVDGEGVRSAVRAINISHDAFRLVCARSDDPYEALDALWLTTTHVLEFVQEHVSSEEWQDVLAGLQQRYNETFQGLLEGGDRLAEAYAAFARPR